MGHLGTAADSGKVAALLSSEDATWITVQIIHVDGGGSLMKPEAPPDLQLGQ